MNTPVVATIGGTRAARIAGQSDAATVTSTPMPSAARTVRSWNTRVWVGMAKPSRLARESSSPASAYPTPRPTADAATPIAAASATTDPMTWRRLAPSARSNPSSRVRCVTRIVKVFEMMNAATTIPMSAKPRSSWVNRSRKVKTTSPRCAAT